MGVTAERVADEDDVVALRGQGAVRLVRHADPMQFASAVEGQRSWQVEEPGLDAAD